MLISAETDSLRVLADPLRARLVELLADGPACTCHLVEDIGATQSNVSNHLRALRQAGLVAREPHGRFTYYRLVPEAVAEVAGRLTGLAERAHANAEHRREC
jgi:ArsR family transcriptional regulator